MTSSPVENGKFKLKYNVGIYLELFGKQFRVQETELVSQKWEECDLVPDDRRGREGSKVEVFPKEMEDCVTSVKT